MYGHAKNPTTALQQGCDYGQHHVQIAENRWDLAKVAAEDDGLPSEWTIDVKKFPQALVHGFEHST